MKEDDKSTSVFLIVLIVILAFSLFGFFGFNEDTTTLQDQIDASPFDKHGFEKEEDW